MNSDRIEHCTKTTKLSPSQAARLTQVLDKIAAQASSVATRLETLREKLADAGFLSTWLREEVHVDLTQQEFTDIAELLATLETKDDLTSGEQELVCDFFAKLREQSVGEPEAARRLAQAAH